MLGKKPLHLSMIRISIMLTFLVAYNFVTAQHINYRDRTKPPPKPVVEAPPKPAIKEVRDSVMTMAEDSVEEVITPHNECPGMDASLPVLTNYVPPEIVKSFKIKFDDHVYSITSIKVSANQIQYKLKVCYKGEFVIRFVDTDGDILR